MIVTPAQPFLDWLHRADETSGEVSLAELRQARRSYLLPEYDTEEEAERHLRKYCRAIFEEHLEGWYRVPSVWPSDRGFRVFKQWFDFHFHSVLFDLCPGPVIKESGE